MTTSIERLARAMLVGFAVVAVALVYWQLVRAPDLIVREDNPRLVLAELRVRRGQLLDRNGSTLASSEPDVTLGTPDVVRRRYPCPEAAHVVGYYSLRYGTGGSEAVFDAALRGRQTQLEHLLHRPPTGADVTLGLALTAQRAGAAELAGRQGALVVLDITTGEVLALVSHPAYDPNRLDDEWDVLSGNPAAPLLNRVTQGVYPVGDLARWIGLAGLLSSGITSPADPYGAPLEELLAPLSPMGYLATAHQLGFDAAPPIDLPGSAGRLPDFGQRATPRDLAVTPLHMARFVAAAAGDGRMPLPRLDRVSAAVPGDRVFASSVAVALRAVMPPHGGVAGWVGVAQPLETGSAPVSWFAGYAPTSQPRWAIVVVVEGAGNGTMVVPVAQRVVTALQSSPQVTARWHR